VNLDAYLRKNTSNQTGKEKAEEGRQTKEVRYNPLKAILSKHNSNGSGVGSEERPKVVGGWVESRNAGLVMNNNFFT